jgi:hypothetical protein
MCALKVLVSTESEDKVQAPITVDGGLIAPDYNEMVFLLRNRTNHSPSYNDLTEDLLRSDMTPNKTVAHVLGTLSGYAYGDTDTLAKEAGRIGLGRSSVRKIGQSVDAALIDSTAYVIQSEDGRVAILCYRGTPPLNLIDWMLDADIYPQKIGLTLANTPGSFDIHAGFYRNVCATYPEVIEVIERALNGRSVLDNKSVPNSLEALYITGHSLGGAMAAIMAVLLNSNSDASRIMNRLKAVYTFGQPMVGSPEFAENCNEDAFLRDNVVRYVYKLDLVPALPPRISGSFAHFGKEQRYICNGQNQWRWKDTTQNPIGQVGMIGDFIQDVSGFANWGLGKVLPLKPILELLAHKAVLFNKIQFWPGTRSVEDHIPNYYIKAVTPPDVLVRC